MKPTDKYAYRLLLGATAFVLLGGTIFYHLVEHWSLINAYYFCVVTLATVGYGDLTPQTEWGRLFTTFYIMIGVGILAAFVNTVLKRRGIRFMDKREKRHNKKDTE